MRSALHRLGLRFRLQAPLPGRPDIVLARHRIVINVHGCYWHRHQGCSLAYTPKSNAAFWKAKFEQNVQRDRRVDRVLRSLGWRVVTVWECQALDADQLQAKLAKVFRVEVQE